MTLIPKPVSDVPANSDPTVPATDSAPRRQQYLAVRNWDKYQPRLKNGHPCREWIRLNTNLEDDRNYLRLTFFQRSLLVCIWRLRGRTGRNVPNDPEYVARALQIEPKQRHNLTRTLHELVASGFLILCNQQNGDEFALHDKTGQDNTEQDNTEQKKEYPPIPLKGGLERGRFNDRAEWSTSKPGKYAGL